MLDLSDFLETFIATFSSNNFLSCQEEINLLYIKKIDFFGISFFPREKNKL